MKCHMAKRGRPITNPKTIKRILLENPPEHIARRVAKRKLGEVSPWDEVIEIGEVHHEVIEAIRKKLQVSRSNLDQVLAGYSEGATEDQLNEAWSVLDKRSEKIAADVSRGGKKKSQSHQPAWHAEATRLADEIKLSRSGIEERLSSSRLSELVLKRWNPTINAPKHRTLREYLSKSL